MYFQIMFAIDRVKALAPQNPGLENEAAVQGRRSKTTCKALAALGEPGISARSWRPPIPA